MPSMELVDYDHKVLKLAIDKGILYRRRFLGWPWGSIIRENKIKALVDRGYLEFIYDWGKDCPAVRATGLGRSVYIQHVERDLTPLRRAA